MFRVCALVDWSSVIVEVCAAPPRVSAPDVGLVPIPMLSVTR
jgi:hypothetical protein